MGCIKSRGLIKINNIDKIKENKNQIEQNKLISTYVSSSECGVSECSDKCSSLQKSNRSGNKNFEMEKESKNWHK